MAGSPVTQSGTLAVSKAVQAANRVWAGPTTGSDAAPAFRALVATDLPDLSSLYQPLDADLTAVAALLSTGIAVRTAANTWAQRTIAGTANQVNVANGDGVAGNPTLSLPQSIHTSAEPQFARLGLGVPAHASFALDAVGALRFLPGVNQALRILRDTGAPSIAFRNEADTAAYAELGYDHTDNEFFAFLTGTTRAVSLWTNSIKRYLLRANGNMLLGRQQALATTATAGFIYVPTCAGTPTGTPETETGLAPIVINTTNHKLYFYSGGAWRDAGP